MTNSSSPEPGEAKTLTQRARWATRKMSVKSGRSKRMSILNRMHSRRRKTDEKPASGDGSDFFGDDVAPWAANPDEDAVRRLYFNIPLPDDMVDENGHPLASYPRNKIRTAKYTPLSFIPKNLWYQFHQIANIFFLFLVILVIFPIIGGEINPGVNAIPIISILTLTAIKDSIEDFRRTMSDSELNNAPVHRLCKWNNVNVEVGHVSLWRRFKKANTRFFGSMWHFVRILWSSEERASRAQRKVTLMVDKEGTRASFESQYTRNSVGGFLGTPRSDRRSFTLGDEEIQLELVQSSGHHQHDGHTQTELPTEEDAKRAAILQAMKPDLVNHDRTTQGASFEKDYWKNLNVGDFVRVYNDDELPADIIILSTSDPDGACYVETKNLDGETNLKIRQALRCGRTLKHARDCERAEFRIESEAPQANLYKYSGAIKWRQKIPGFPDDEPEDMVEPISNENLLLRGCNLRNTEWALGVVVYTGHDTKIMMNSGITPSKRARIAREMNFNVICNLGILLAMCLMAAIVNGVAWAQTDASLHYFAFGAIGGSPPMTGFITFWASINLFQNLVPISLYITLEIVRTLQAIFIYSDVEMYYAEIDQPCIPKTWNISDDVGQIEYIFSDKTGTLTQNVMEFKKATVNGQPYGEAFTEAQAGMEKRDGVGEGLEQRLDRIRAQLEDAKARTLQGLRKLYDNPYLHDEALTFVAPDFVQDMAGESGPEQKAANEYFMLALALCHSVIADRLPTEPPRIEFKAESPDEEALVATARDMGFIVTGNSGEGINLNVMGEERHYQVLNTIEFNSSRKRMSSIVRMPDDRIVLICKGADSVIYARLKKGEQKELRAATAEHLEMFAREGLRTLCIAQRELTEDEYKSWKREHDIAAAALDDREEKLEAVAELVEQGLYLLGGTAIEDRLQQGVPDAIALLANAGIKLWVLTGDKVETAINIGFSCNLLNNGMDLIHLQVLEDESEDLSEEALLDMMEKMLDENLQIFGMTGSDEELEKARKNHEAPDPTHGLVIDGFTLRWALDERVKQKFLLLCKQCRSVLCCRVSPAQKASVVGMVKNGLDVMTLSIGDGANDVAMIQEADVGVGIAGLEGRQAAMSSDYAIGQFRFLERLVLVHGRWSYRRMAESISNFFYKNMVWVWSIFWFEIYCNFDITFPFDYSYIIMFNLFFTSVPVCVMGVLDQDVSDKVSLAVPQLYRRGIERAEWTQTKFWIYMADGVYQSVMVFFVPYFVFRSGSPATLSGLSVADRVRFGAYMAHPAVVAINNYILINTYRWDWLMLLIVAISDLFIFFWTGIYSSFSSSGFFYGTATQVYREASFWAVFFVVPIMCLFPRYALKALQKVYFPYDVDIIREQERLGLFKNLDEPKKSDSGDTDGKEQDSKSLENTTAGKHRSYGSVDESLRPIYPPSTTSRMTHNPRSQNGSDSTGGYGTQRFSAENPPLPIRRSMDRARPSFDRVRASMDRMRPSFEASNDVTSAARLTRIESSHSEVTGVSRFKPSRLRGFTLTRQHD